MPLVTFLTGSDLPVEDRETPLVASELAALGVISRTIRWSDDAALAQPSDLVVIRSTWDYTAVVGAFIGALRTIRGRVANPVDVVEWNSHKSYLTELADAGVAVVPTAVVRPGESPDLGAGKVIIKPAVSAGAMGIGRFDAADPAALQHVETLLRTGDVLVQPFQPEVIDGERSLMYFGGEFSYAVRKVPADRDFRVHVEYGGTVHEYQPTDAEMILADSALAQVAANLLYARVDLISTADGPLLMELELIEPELFLRHSAGSAARFARAILQWSG